MLLCGHSDLLPCPGPNCFLCVQVFSRQRVRWELKWPSADSQTRIRDNMLIPVMRRVCAAAPTILDAWWIANPPRVRPAFRGDEKLRALLFDICHALKRTPCVESIHCLLLSMINILQERGFISREAMLELRVQVHELNNSDAVTHDMLHFLRDRAPGKNGLQAMLSKMAGAEDHGMRVADGFQGVLSALMHTTQRLTRRGRAEMQAKYRNMELLKRYVETFGDKSRRLAITMAMHDRLGGDAAIGELSAELLHMIVDFATAPEPVRYEMKFFY
jgi:hypothetical protein